MARVTTPYRSDSGLVIDVASLGPAKRTGLPAGFPAGIVAMGHVILLGYSWINSAGAGQVQIFDGAAQAQLLGPSTYFAAAGEETQWFGDSGIELKRGLYVSASIATISGAVFYIVLQDD